MHKAIALLILVGGVVTPLMAGVAPEIDSSSAVVAVAAIGGAVLLIRSRRKS